MKAKTGPTSTDRVKDGSGSPQRSEDYNAQPGPQGNAQKRKRKIRILSDNILA